MSRGLGAAQNLALSALASLEAENGAGGQFYVWAIVDRIYALSPGMRDRHRAMMAAIDANTASVRERAARGDDRAALYLSLTRSIARARPSPRTRRTSPFGLTETRLNPSRLLASLERRGLVSRHAIQGGGSAGLTDEGRDMAARLSVGTTLPFETGGADV